MRYSHNPSRVFFQNMMAGEQYLIYNQSVDKIKRDFASAIEGSPGQNEMDLAIKEHADCVEVELVCKLCRRKW